MSEKAKLIFDWNKIYAKARLAVAEGCVLVRNEDNALPIKKGEKVALFGRSQFNYYKSGTGSGGCVNVPYVTGILEALQARDKAGDIILDEEVLSAYKEWLLENPFDAGQGWAAEPWNQKEMPLTDEFVKESAERNDIAVMVIGRTAGEDKDNRVAAGSYLLTETECDVLQKLTSFYKRVVVLLNTGNIIDMKWVETCKPSAVMYVWQGGMAGGDGAVDVLMGEVNPSGCLPDTVAEYSSDYPAASNFGDDNRNFYVEDVYVGYRYFETFAPDKVLYPFGYGLSYTSFDFSCVGAVCEEKDISFSINITNTGTVAGAKVVQVYVQKPQGNLGKPIKELVGYKRSDIIAPGATRNVTITVPMNLMASYDDSGCTGHKSCYVVEAGDYSFWVGENVRDSHNVYSINIGETVVVSECVEALAPVLDFERMRPGNSDSASGVYTLTKEKVSTRTIDLHERIKTNRPEFEEYTGDRGIKLVDVYDNKNTLEEFLAQLSDEDLICMSRGEGMCSPKVTAGTASAFGGVTKSLADFGIPVGCCADGPSGIRMDCGSLAFAMPNGACMASSFDDELVEDLYELEGMDLRKNKVDFLLGPGINMHRHPLNGRNFEYFSEDPLLTGKMAAAQLRGMAKQGVSGTVKHFVGNEQEHRRNRLDSVVSERALREIYLKPFELAVKEGGAYSVMTSYGAVNGIWTAGNYDLVTTILRNEWGFEGIAMTDWWAVMNEEGEEPSMQNTTPMIRAQNDVYMVVSDSLTNTAKDNTAEGLAEGKITRAELIRNAANICKVLMKSRCMKRLVEGDTEEWSDVGLPEGALETIDWKGTLEMEEKGEIDLSQIPTDKGCVDQIDVTFKKRGYFKVTFELSSDASELAQMPMSIYNGTGLLGMISITGTSGEIVERSVELVAEVTLSANVKLKFGMSGIKVHKMIIELDREYTVK